MKQIAGVLLGLAMVMGVVRADDPAEVTKTAYETDLAHFGFDAATVRADKPFLTPALYRALLKKANQPVAKGDAPDIEGDVIFNAQDLPTKWEVGSASIDGAKATVPVTLHWDSEKLVYQIYLVQVNGAWKITEIDYGKDGKLSDLLK